MTKDERAAKEAAKEYHKAIKKFGLDNIQDGWGQSKRRYMMDSFYAGFYAGRDYERDKITDQKIYKAIDKLLDDIKSRTGIGFDEKSKDEIDLLWFNIIERIRF